MNTLIVETTLVTTSCIECGMEFAVPDFFMEKLKNTGKTFYCPNGHPLHYGKTKIDTLNEEIQWYRNRWKEERDDHRQTRNSLRGTKAALTRTKNRIKNGVCPCCKRHFENLQRHIETKHPNYATEEA